MLDYGFVYIWYDTKHKMFYIGSHWGDANDGYICSSNRMRDAYRRRPSDFKRRILTKVYTDRTDLLKEEQRYLSMIEKKEFGIKYYNINSLVCKYHWWANETTRRTVAEKISASISGKRYTQKNPCKKRKPMSEETKRKIGNANKTSQLGNKNKLGKTKG